jgi:thioredoxin-like negative regulator of GroEL
MQLPLTVVTIDTVNFSKIDTGLVSGRSIFYGTSEIHHLNPLRAKLVENYTGLNNKGRADIIFIDVWKNPEQAKRFKVKAIPTQIFFDRDGKEVDRNVGFMKESAIVGKLQYLGVE